MIPAAASGAEERPPGERQPITERIATGPSRGTGPLVALLVGLVAIAILKPWDLLAPAASDPLAGLPGGTGASPSPGPVAAASPPRPTPRASLDPNATPCMSANGARLVTLIRTPTQDVRSWQLVDGAVGRDAFQPGLVPVRIPSQHVIGLGICGVPPAVSAGQRAGAELLDVTLVDVPAGAIEDLGRPEILSSGDGPEDAVLYEASAPVRRLPVASPPVPSDGFVSGPFRLGAWAPGTYAAAFRYPADPAGVVRWIRFDIVSAPGIFG
ncbi:MAG TPA: hypothetical protein VFW20_08290 [Candidatus Limnocylindrales bacterium]|nr:hypothetical protein [Candidatus Limnocylindrales bacterium]